jgi:hypothetical protein
LEECKCLELSRIAAIKESLIELSHMQSSICDEDKNAYTSLCTAVEDLNIDEEVESLIWSVDRLVINDSTNDPSLMNDIERNVHVVSGDFYPAERTKNTSAIFHKVQKTLEVLDFLLKVVNSVTTSLKAVADAKKTYSKAMHKCFEKHGLVSPNSGPSLGCFSIPLSPTMPINQNRGVLSGAKGDGLKRFQSQLLATGLDSSVGGIFQELIPDLFSELLSRIESPSFVSLWLATVSAFGGISDAHNETAEKYNEIYLPTLNSIQRRVLAMKNELMTKQTSSIKLIDNSQATVLKLSQKIEKARFLIKTQQEKVERSKEEVGLMVSPSSAGGSGSPRRQEIDDDTEETNSMKTRSVSPIPDDDNVAVGEINKDREKDDMKKDKEGDRIGKASKIMQQGLDQFGSRFQKARIKVLRSENQEDRLERREGRMVALELEEKDLLTTFYAANASMDFIEESVRREIDSNLKAAKEIICHDITSFMDILKQLSTNHRDCVPLFEIPVKAFETLCDCFDGQIELCHFTTSVQNAFQHPDVPLSPEEEKNPTVTHFTPLYNKAVEDEKALQGIFSDPNRSEHEHEVDRDVQSHKQNPKANVEEVQNNNNNDHQNQGKGTLNYSSRAHDTTSNTPIESNVDSKSSSDTVIDIKDTEQKHNTDQNDVSAGPLPSPDGRTSQQLDPKGATTQSDALAADSDDVNLSIAVAAEAGVVKKTDLHIEIFGDKVSLQGSDVASSVSCPSADVPVEAEDSADTTGQGKGKGEGHGTPHTSAPLQRDSSAVKVKVNESDGDVSYDPYRALESSIKAAASMLSPEVLLSSLGTQEKAISDINTTENEDETEGLSRCARMTEEHVQLTKGFAEFQTKDLLIAELIRQKLLTEDAYSERAGDGMSGTSTACMSPTALPPRPPLPPRLRRSEGKDRSKDKDRERDKDKDREKGNHAADIGSPVIESSSTPVLDSPSIHHKSSQVMSEANRSLPIQIMTEETPEKVPQLHKTGTEDDVKSRKTDVEKVIEVVESEGSMKTVCTMKEIKDSPKVMRTTERVSHIGVDGSHVTVSNTTIGVNKKVPQSFGNKPEDSSELVKFGLSPTVRVLESFSCALYPKKGLLTHGRSVVDNFDILDNYWHLNIFINYHSFTTSTLYSSFVTPLQLLYF